MTHELRTPLNGVIGLLELAIKLIGETTEIVTEFLLPANNCAYYLLNQINCILDSSKMKFKKLKISKQSVKIRSIFDIVKRLLNQKAKSKKIELKFEI